MYLDEKNEWSRPEPEKNRPSLSPDEVTVLLRLVALLTLALFLLPIGGATVVDALIALLAG